MNALTPQRLFAAFAGQAFLQSSTDDFTLAVGLKGEIWTCDGESARSGSNVPQKEWVIRDIPSLLSLSAALYVSV